MYRGRSAAYCQYYDRQRGDEIPVFRGGQHGAGIGDVLRGILRFIAPIALKGITTFASSTIAARDKGASLADAARSAVAPSLTAMAGQLAGNIQHGGVLDNIFKGDQGVPHDKMRLPAAATHDKVHLRTATHVYKSGEKRKSGSQHGGKKAKHSKHSGTQFNF